MMTSQELYTMRLYSALKFKGREKDNKIKKKFFLDSSCVLSDDSYIEKTYIVVELHLQNYLIYGTLLVDGRIIRKYHLLDMSFHSVYTQKDIHLRY
jgi:hypothetical protein